MVADADTRLTLPWIADGTIWWLEGRPSENGRVVLMNAVRGGDPVDVVPPGFNVRSTVHEYGGGAYAVHEGTAYCSRFEDQRLYRVEPGSDPVPITPEHGGRLHRYADGRVTPDGRHWVGVRERHSESGRSDDVVNELVSIPTDGSEEPAVIAGGRDFYACPRISTDGTAISFLAWDLPWMPWDGCELFSATLFGDGTLGEVVHIAGRDGEESIWQPTWGPAGELVFASDRSGWWNLERVAEGRRTVLLEAEAEFGYPAWILGASSYAFLGDSRILCAYERDGRTSFGILDPETGDLEERGPPIRRLVAFAVPRGRAARPPSSSQARRRSRTSSSGSTSRAARPKCSAPRPTCRSTSSTCRSRGLSSSRPNGGSPRMLSSTTR